MSTDDEDVKALLGRALAGEPPLRLDRDEVFRQGKRKLRNRRRFEAGGTVVGVVAAAVGAVVLTGLIADEPEEEAPPAASQTAERPAPPGPTLPLTTTSTLPPPPSATDTATSVDHARKLSVVLIRSAVLGKDMKLTGVTGEPVAFRPNPTTYDLEVDVHAPDSEGALIVSVGTADPVEVADCTMVEEPFGDCESHVVAGVIVVLAGDRDHDSGEKRRMVFTIRPDGTSVTAIATNLSGRQRDAGQRPADVPPVLTDDMLGKLAVIPDLRYAG